jgi:hypothetical protein
MKIFNIISVSAISLSMIACSDPVLTTKEIKALSIQQFAETACNSVINANFDQLELMTSERDLSKLKKEYDKNSDRWGELEDNMFCLEPFQESVNKNGRRWERFTFSTRNEKRGLSLSIMKNDNGFFINHFRL